MADKKISELAAATSVAGSDLVVIADPSTGAMKKAVVSLLPHPAVDTPTLDQVTDEGATTGNLVTVGGITISTVDDVDTEDVNMLVVDIATGKVLKTTLPGGGESVIESVDSPLTIDEDKQLSIPAAGGGQDGYLTHDDWNTFNGKQDLISAGNISETGSSVIELNAGAGAAATVLQDVTIEVKQAGASQDGYLSTADWNTFNEKSDGVVISTGLTEIAGVVTNNLSTGVTGGQAIIGGTQTGDSLLLQGTSANGTSTATAIQAKVGNNGATTAVTILNNARFGFGTTNPQTRVVMSAPVGSLSANLNLNNNPTEDEGAYLASTAANNFTLTGGVKLLAGSWQARATEAGIFFINDSTGGFVFFADTALTVGSNYSPTERMRLTNDGKLGIGTGAPSEMLHVIGNIISSGTLKLGATADSVSGSDLIVVIDATGLIKKSIALSDIPDLGAVDQDIKVVKSTPQVILQSPNSDNSVIRLTESTDGSATYEGMFIKTIGVGNRAVIGTHNTNSTSTSDDIESIEFTRASGNVVVLKDLAVNGRQPGSLLVQTAKVDLSADGTSVKDPKGAGVGSLTIPINSLVAGASFKIKHLLKLTSSGGADVYADYNTRITSGSTLSTLRIDGALFADYPYVEIETNITCMSVSGSTATLGVISTLSARSTLIDVVMAKSSTFNETVTTSVTAVTNLSLEVQFQSANSGQQVQSTTILWKREF